MSIFTPIANTNQRVLCSICNKVVASKSKNDHEQYHIQGDSMLGPMQGVCPLCNTPKSLKAANFISHLTGFHNLSDNKAKGIEIQAKIQAEKRRENVKQKIREQAEQKAMMDDENNIDQEVIRAYNQRNQPQPQPQPRPQPQPQRNLKRIPFLEGENEIDRERRLNRQYVQKFRTKVRAERGLPPPKEYDRSKIEGETREERDRRKGRERLRAFRARKKQAIEQEQKQG